jgi:hypothetical protein
LNDRRESHFYIAFRNSVEDNESNAQASRTILEVSVNGLSARIGGIHEHSDQCGV